MVKTIILLIITYIFNLIDYWQTTYAIQYFGLGIEANPITRFLFEHNCAGIVKIIAPAILLTSLGFIVKIDKKQIWAVYVAFTLFLLVIMHNFATLIRMGIF